MQTQTRGRAYIPPKITGFYIDGQFYEPEQTVIVPEGMQIGKFKAGERVPKVLLGSRPSQPVQEPEAEETYLSSAKAEQVEELKAQAEREESTEDIKDDVFIDTGNDDDLEDSELGIEEPEVQDTETEGGETEPGALEAEPESEVKQEPATVMLKAGLGMLEGCSTNFEKILKRIVKGKGKKNMFYLETVKDGENEYKRLIYTDGRMMLFLPAGVLMSISIWGEKYKKGFTWDGSSAEEYTFPDYKHVIPSLNLPFDVFQQKRMYNGRVQVVTGDGKNRTIKEVFVNHKREAVFNVTMLDYIRELTGEVDLEIYQRGNAEQPAVLADSEGNISAIVMPMRIE